MVAAGIAILIASAILISRSHHIVPQSLKSKWSLLTILICFFAIGYCSYLLIRFTRIDFPLEILISSIFLGGSLFVYGIISLTHYTLYELKKLNDSLEDEVGKRTLQLNNLNMSLLNSEKEVVQQNTFLGSVIDAISHPFYVIDVNTYDIVLVNRASGIDLSGPQRTCYWLTHRLTSPCRGNEHPCPIMEVRKSGSSVVVEHVHLTGSGEKQIVELHGSPIYDESGELIQIIEYCIDITYKKKTEQALTTAKQIAESANNAKSRFLAHMSHEIRTPMNAIMGMSHLALRTNLDHQQRNYIEKVYSSTELLLGIIDDILDFSKMEAGQLQLNNAPFDLRHLVESVVSTLSVMAENKGLTLQAIVHDDLPPVFVGDDMRLRQILLNLAGNAIKFTPTGSVTIKVAFDDKGEVDGKRLLHFSVIDTGIGIQPEKLELIFDSFEQTDTSYARQYGGTGLGLSICKQLITLMTGRIWAESQVSIGSSFHLIVPLQSCADELVTKLASNRDLVENIIKGQHILVVDDNDVNRDLLCMMLEKDHVVQTATNGLAALTALASRCFDVILMDVQMPVMDGLSATAIIRAFEKGDSAPKELPQYISKSLATNLVGGHVPIVAMTAHAMDEDKEMCILAGMDRYITKPFHYDQLLAALQSLIGQIPAEPDTKYVGLINDSSSALVHHSQQVVTREDIENYFKTVTNFTDEQIARLVVASRRSINENLEKATTSLQIEDYQELGLAAHTLKGILAQCGLSVLAEKAQEIHTKAKINRDFLFAESLDEIRNSLAGFLEDL